MVPSFSEISEFIPAGTDKNQSGCYGSLEPTCEELQAFDRDVDRKAKDLSLSSTCLVAAVPLGSSFLEHSSVGPGSCLEFLTGGH